MKRNTPTHPKVDALMDELEIPRYAAVGLLESLWHITAANTPRGDVGKFKNKTLARRLDWDGDPDQLVNALVSSGWIDEHDEHRLVIHDWSDHADDSTQMKVGRLGKPFADGKTPNLSRMAKDEREKCLSAIGAEINDPCTRDAQVVSTALPSPPLPKPSPPKPSPAEVVPTPQPESGSGSIASLGGDGVGDGVARDARKILDACKGRFAQHGPEISRLLLEAGVESEKTRIAISQRTDLSPDLVRRTIDAVRADPNASEVPRLVAYRLKGWKVEKLEQAARVTGASA